MKNYLPAIYLGAAALGVIYWLRKKAAAGANLRYEIEDIAIDIPAILQSNFQRIKFNTKIRFTNDESVNVNVKQVNLDAYIGTRKIGKILNNNEFTIQKQSSKVVTIQTNGR